MELQRYFSYVNHFALDNLPELSEDKGSKEQVEMCFKAYHNPNWQAEFE